MARIRIASLNVENLFERPKAMAGQMQPGGNTILAAHARINALIQEDSYTPAVKIEILQLLDSLGLTASDSASFAVLRQIRDRLVTRHRATATDPASTEVVADGRGDWIGWVDLVKERVDELAMTHTAKVIEDVDADIIAVVEAESRIALKHFTDAGVVTSQGGPAYPHVMVIDGNDDRGIDVGLMTKPTHSIVAVHPHVDDKDAGDRLIFGRDCPEYTVQLASGTRIIVLVNHFKSKGYGLQSDNDAKRRQQATRVAEIYGALRARGEENVVVLGDLNDTPASDPLKPLLQDTDLRDIANPPCVFQRRPARDVCEWNRQPEDRLCAVVTGAVLQRHGRRDLPERRLGWKERHAFPALPDYDLVGPCGIGSCGDLRGR